LKPLSPVKYRGFTLGSLLLVLFITAGSIQACYASIRSLSNSLPDKSMVLEDRGRWSVGPDDQFIDLAGKWNLIVGDKAESDSIDLPFVWDDWEGVIEISRNFYLPRDYFDYRWKLVIDGASQAIKIALNGVNLDTRRSDDASFQLDLNPRTLRFEPKQNHISIRLSNRLDSFHSPPLRGSIFSRKRYGGIARGVYLVASPHAQIIDLSAKWVGGKTDRNSYVEIELEMRESSYSAEIEGNDSPEYKYQIQLLNPSGHVAYATDTTRLIFPERKISKKVIRIPYPDINPWEISGFPDIYTAQATLIRPDGLHRSSAIFGALTLDLDEKGFKINNVRRNLKCISYLNADPNYGNASPTELIEMDLKLIKELGINAIRVAQGTATPDMLHLCDRMGLLVFTELAVFQVPDDILGDVDFINSTAGQMEELIRRDRRFTCIAGWGIGSEINPPNSTNGKYYSTLTNLIHQLDDRPVYAAIPFSKSFRAAPLDLVILELTKYSPYLDQELPNVIDGDRPAMLGGIKRTIMPGNIGGWEDPTSEAGQAKFIVDKVRQAENLDWCIGIVTGDFGDWMGMIPSISGPFHGSHEKYATGLVTPGRLTRPAYQRLKEFWASRSAEPLSRGMYSGGEPALLLVFGIILIFVLLAAMRQNNIFRFNLMRTFTSPRGFFQDISDFRYFQSGHTLLLTVLISGGLGLVGASWLHAHRESYAVDWFFGYILGSTELIGWVGTVFWQPFRAFLFCWLVTFVLVWIGAFQSSIISSLFVRKRTFIQSFDYVVWAGAPMLILLPLGSIAARLYSRNGDILLNGLVTFLIFWSLSRLIWVYKHHIRKPIGVVVVLWIGPPFVFVVCCLIALDYLRSFSSYWDFIGSTIVQGFF